MKKERAVVCIHTAKSFCDFIWYYSTYGQQYEWDIVVDFYNDDEPQVKYYKQFNIFKNIICIKDVVWNHKYKFLLSAMMNFFIFRKKKFIKNIINKDIDLSSYSKVLLCADNNYLEGFFIALSKEIDVEILEDGTLDYFPRSKAPIKVNNSMLFSFVYWILAKMGYMNVYGRYYVKNTKYCTKYCSFPDRLKYTNYAQINKLNDFSNTDKNMYDSLVKEIFNYDVECIDKNRKNLVLLTTPMDDFFGNVEQINNVTCQYIRENYPDYNIYIKRHPRDHFKYDIDEIMEFDKNTPAELILTAGDFDKEIYMFPSSILMFTNENHNIEILNFEKYIDEKATGCIKYKDTFEKAMEIEKVDNNKVVYLD